MSELTKKKCLPCEGGVDPLTTEQATTMMAELHDNWQLAEDGKWLHREFKFDNFYEALSYLNAVAHMANVQDHHPDMELGWGRVKVSYTTHAIGGLSENDFICAAKADDLLDP